MKILAIDPGPAQSAWLIYDTAKKRPLKFGIEQNGELRHKTKHWAENREMANYLVIEMVASYGMPVGKDVFDTCFWIGQFISDWWWSGDYTRVYRRDVKMHLCHNMRAKDSNVRQALIDRFGPGREKAIGIKKAPGPLYRIKKDLWSALAVAVTWSDIEGEVK